MPDRAARAASQPTQREDNAVFRANLPAELTSAGRARTAVRQALAAWNMTDKDGDAELLASELVANAAEHGGGPIRLTVRREQAGLRCEVTDTSPAAPQPRSAALDAERGRGLAIVSALADTTGTQVEQDGAGKTTWFTLALAERIQQNQPARQPEADLEAGA